MKPGIKRLAEQFSFEEFEKHLKSLFKAGGKHFDLSSERLKHIYDTGFYGDLQSLEEDPLLIKQFPSKMAKTYLAIPLCEADGRLCVGLENPYDTEKIETIESVIGQKVIPVLVDRSGLVRLFSRYYANYGLMKSIADQFAFHGDATQGGKPSFLGEFSGTNKVAEFFEHILEDAAQMNASDVHLELFERTFYVKFRVNGKLVEYKFPDGDIAHYILRYMKVIANADIAEENKPMDGKHVSVEVGNGTKINLRMSIMPTGFGYSAVIRLLVDNKDFNLKKVIPDEGYYNELTGYLGQKQGMFIVSGPTGSGKSTTLYGSISAINTPEKKIITLEDPIELKMEGLTQVQINNDIGYDYSSALRAILRQDPDVIMIAEIRDPETAQAAMKAAITGHMVLSTIHTRSVKDIPLRFLDLGIDAFSVSSALKLLASQRLLRLLCPHCRKPVTVDPAQKEVVRKHFDWVKDSDFDTMFEAVGCQFCNDSGYATRRIIFEHIQLTSAMMKCLTEEDLGGYEREVEKVLKGQTLADNAMRAALKGETSLAEALSYMS